MTTPNPRSDYLEFSEKMALFMAPVVDMFFLSADWTLGLLIDALTFSVTGEQGGRHWAELGPALFLVHLCRVFISWTCFLLAGTFVTSEDTKGALELLRTSVALKHASIKEENAKLTSQSSPAKGNIENTTDNPRPVCVTEKCIISLQPESVNEAEDSVPELESNEGSEKSGSCENLKGADGSVEGELKDDQNKDKEGSEVSYQEAEKEGERGFQKEEHSAASENRDEKAEANSDGDQQHSG